MTEKTIHLGISGTREGLNNSQHDALERLLCDLSEHYDIIKFRHGDCIGVDSQAHDIATSMKFIIILHPPIKNKYRAYNNGCHIRHTPKDYNIRNCDIVDGSELLIAVPQQLEKERGGTWHAIKYARKIKKPLIIIKPDGTYKIEMSTYHRMKIFNTL